MSAHKKAAAMLQDVRKSGKRLAELPTELQPVTLDDAYAVQDEIVRLNGAIGGWKVSVQERTEGRFAAPIPAPEVLTSPAKLTLPKGIEVEIEGEIAMKVTKDLPPRTSPYTHEEVAAAIGSIHPAIEVLGSRFQDRKAQPKLVAVADSQSNAGIVYGAGVSDWKKVEFANVKMRSTYDGAAAGKADGGPTTALVMDAVVHLANNAAATRGGLRSGQMIITGARIKPMALNRGVLAEVVVEGIGSVSLTVV